LLHGIDKEERSSGIHIWKQFSYDVLGLRPKDASHADDASTIAEICKRFRIVGLKLDGTDGAEADAETMDSFACADATDMYRGGGSPEFTLIGSIKDDAGLRDLDIDNIEWLGMVHTEMSEPFATCRVQFDFNSGQEGTPLDTHLKWAKEVWRKSEEGTKKIFDEIVNVVQAE